MSDVSRLLVQIDSGDAKAADELLPLVYDELRKLAASKLCQEKPGQTLQATALVHEAFLRLIGSASDDPAEDRKDWSGRAHFFAAAAEAMRRILVENARRKKQLKRGGNRQRQEINELELATPNVNEDLVALDEALDRLKIIDPRASQLVQLRYFGGFPIAEAAGILGISPRTADRLWVFARSWLRCEMADFEGKSEEKD